MRMMCSNNTPPVYSNGANPVLPAPQPPAIRQVSNYAPVRQPMPNHIIPQDVQQRPYSEMPGYGENAQPCFNPPPSQHTSRTFQTMAPVPSMQNHGMYDNFGNQAAPSRGYRARMYPSQDCVYSRGVNQSDNDSFSDSSDDDPLTHSTSAEMLNYSLTGDFRGHKRKRRRSKYSRRNAGRSKLNETVVLQLPSQPPKSIPDAVCMYIDYLIAENEAKTDISTTEPINKHMFIRLEDEDYAREALRKDVGFPTPKFQEWLRLYNFEVQVCHNQSKKRSVAQAPLCNPNFGPKPNMISPNHATAAPANPYAYVGSEKHPGISQVQKHPPMFPPPQNAIAQRPLVSDLPTAQFPVRPTLPDQTLSVSSLNQPFPTQTLPPISSFTAQGKCPSEQNANVHGTTEQDEDTTTVAQILGSLTEDVHHLIQASPVITKQSLFSHCLNTPEAASLYPEQEMDLAKSPCSFQQNGHDSEMFASEARKNTEKNASEAKVVTNHDQADKNEEQIEPIKIEPQAESPEVQEKICVYKTLKNVTMDENDITECRRSSRKRAHVKYTE